VKNSMTLKGESLLPFISSDMTFTRWRTAAISKMVFHYKLSRPISIQFGYADPNYYFENGHWWKIKFCQIQDGKRAVFFGYISAPYCAISAKFGARKHNHMLTRVTSPE